MARAGVYSEHDIVEKDEVRYPVRPAKLTIVVFVVIILFMIEFMETYAADENPYQEGVMHGPYLIEDEAAFIANSPRTSRIYGIESMEGAVREVALQNHSALLAALSAYQGGYISRDSHAMLRVAALHTHDDLRRLSRASTDRAEQDGHERVDIGSILTDEERERLLNPLDEHERDLLRYRFGLDSGRPRSLQEAADRFGLTVADARTAEQLAFMKLREAPTDPTK